MKCTLIRFSILVLTLLSVTRLTIAQTTFGAITGTVSDPTGAVIPGAKVTVTNHSIEQVNLQFGNTQAEFATAGQWTVITKSGTNDFHGTGYWGYNSHWLNARDYFATSTPFRVYHDYSGSIGGPIRKNKTFLFGNYERSKESAHTLINLDVPLPAWRQGNFGSLSRSIIDPTTGNPFPGNAIPADRISGPSQGLQSLYPQPNFGAPGLQSANYRVQVPGYTGHTNFYHFTTRVDHHVGDSDRIFGRVNYRRMPRTQVAGLPEIGTWDQVYQGRGAVVSWTHLFGPALLAEFRAGGSHIGQRYHLRLLGNEFLQKYGIRGVNAGDDIYGVPVFNITGVSSINGIEQRNAGGTNYQFTNNVSWTHQGHFMKFGVDYIRDGYFGEILPGNIFGQYNFTGIYTGLAYADFLLGIPQTTSVAARTPPRDFRGNLLALYAQDQFKVNRKLTLNFGLRYQYLGAYYPLSSAMYTFDPETGALVIPDDGLQRVNPNFPKNIPVVSASQAGYPARSLVKSDRFSLQPRAGLAYKLASATVIRAGYGIYSNTVYGQLAQKMQGGPFSGSVTYNNALQNGMPLFSFPEPFLATGSVGTQDVQGTNPKVRMPYTQQWNLTLEHEVAAMGLRTTYLGTHSVNLLYQRNLNQPPASTTPFSNSRRIYPLYNRIAYDDIGGNQQYHALEMAATKRAGKNLTFSLGWTWGKDLTDVQDTTTYGAGVIENQYDRRGERADGRGTLTHRVFSYGVYALPLGRNQRFLTKGHPVVEHVLGSWELSWTAVTQSGNFFNPTFAAFDPSNTGTFGGRPDRIGDGNLSSGRTINRWFDVSAFKIPGCPDTDPVCARPANVGRFGNSGLNILRAPSISGMDLALMKGFSIRERARLQLRLLMNNALNHPIFTLPRSNISAPGTVATINSTTRVSSGVKAQREVHLVVRLEF